MWWHLASLRPNQRSRISLVRESIFSTSFLSIYVHLFLRFFLILVHILKSFEHIFIQTPAKHIILFVRKILVKGCLRGLNAKKKICRSEQDVFFFFFFKGRVSPSPFKYNPSSDHSGYNHSKKKYWSWPMLPPTCNTGIRSSLREWQLEERMHSKASKLSFKSLCYNF